MNIKTIAKGAAAGAAVGFAYYAFSSASPLQKMSIKRDANKTLKAAGHLINDLKSIVM